MDFQQNTPDQLQQIVQSAQRMGIEMNENDAAQWLTAMQGEQAEPIVLNEHSGIFGHKVSLLDFSDKDLVHFRKIGKLVEFEDQPGKVETALALSGSAAQSKIQTYPGDADYFERVNIIAETRSDACTILRDLMREKALQTIEGDWYRLIEVKFGSLPFDAIRNGRLEHSTAPIAWQPGEIKDGYIEVLRNSMPTRITWEEAAQNPGWCKLDWIVADTQRKQLVNASNMLDVTWESPDGSITPLDGYLDSFFQEVYLDAQSIPIFSKLVKHVSGNALDDYVSQLEKEVYKYVTKTPNYGKAAKRMYNIFRLTGRYDEAAYLRELFDEPTTMLYQVWSLIRTIDESFQPGSEIDSNIMLEQTDKLILAVIETLEGEKEVEIVRYLLNLKRLLSDDAERGQLSPQAEAAREEVINIVNNFFYEKLNGLPSIRAYMEGLQRLTN
ncbi:MAG: hypothetical protein CVU39_15830 [Chloroflexi bacterium HGW-Chloroflexi-10]|nr:MAG: hypothetical protein CVU39_15830 [Chloroflexi bacterium HGW-Chloroflexi-10]